MSRDITNLSIGGWVAKHPDNFVDSTDPGIKMGEAAPFSDKPIQEVKEVKDTPHGERWGFTHRYFTKACQDSPEVKKIKARLFNKGGNNERSPDAASP